MNDDDPRHGTNAGHNAGCRQSCCRSAKLRYDKRRKWEAAQGNSRKVPSLGATRRVRALRALGWSVTVQAEFCGLDYRQLYDIGRFDTCYRRTHDQIAAMYERLAMQLPPTSTQSQKHSVTKTRRTAKRNGWPPPLAWDDIDNPDEQPRGWRYSGSTRAEQLADLDEQAVGIEVACKELDISRRSLERWCERHDLRAIYERMVLRDNPHGGWQNQHGKAVAS